jgi:cobalamin biosynthesis Co2+ chelatase CbiK
METNAKKVLESLPSFDDLLKTVDEIKELSIKKMKMDATIKELESVTFKEVMSNPKYLVNGKQPAVSYYENAYKHTGIDNDLLSYRNDYSEVVSELDAKKAQYDLYRQMHDFWKTLVYLEKSGY